MNIQKNMCIYYFENDINKMSNAHIFPKSIGGRIAIKSTCVDCNSLIGRTIENTIKDNLFFVTGIAQTGIQNLGLAYRNIDIVDPKTERKYYYKDNQLVGKRQVINNGEIVRGSKEFVIEFVEAWISKNRPYWLEYFKEEVRKGSSQINIAGDIFSISQESKDHLIQLKGSNKFPFSILAKICYEILRGTLYISNPHLFDFYNDIFDVRRIENKVVNIDIKSNFYARTALASSASILNDIDNYHKLKYEKVHWVRFGYSENKTVYLKIVFFNLLKFIIPVMQLEKKYIDSELIDKLVLFPIDQADYYIDDNFILNDEVKEHEDFLSDIMWNKSNNRQS